MATKIIKRSFITENERETRALGKKIARNLHGNEIIALVGDLGAGKTQFAKGLAEGLGIKQTITSPTYNIHRRYAYKRNRYLSHYDMYRLEGSDLSGLQFDELIGEDIILIEWADRIKKYLPSTVIWIDIKIKNNQRIINSRVLKDYEYVLEKLK